MNFKTYADLSNDIRNNLSKISHMGFDLVVGLPRSGMIPAYMIALSLNIDCTDLNSFLGNTPLKKGTSRKYRSSLIHPQDAKRILLVDDCIAAGKSLIKDWELIPNEFRNSITTLAVYSHGYDHIRSRNDIDIYFEHVLLPCVFEWNVLHHAVMKHACVDIDGVLCIDPSGIEDDDGHKYLYFLQNAKPFILPSTRVQALVTSRLEKYRPQTEAWLKKHDVEYESLIMLDLPTKEERIRLKASGKHKANYYNKSDSQFFIESSVDQSIEICKLTGKLVYCTANGVLYRPDTFRFMRHNFIEFRRALLRRAKAFLRPIYGPVKSFVKRTG